MKHIQTEMPNFKITQKSGKFYLWKVESTGKRLMTIDTRASVVITYYKSLMQGYSSGELK